mmetsp:Transcript_25550/g.59882  ORF Transcript_25550/g.59882 Transcript_25550/m.59882 type:complete len:413 (+) Transcript_25550:2803-4041(+)
MLTVLELARKPLKNVPINPPPFPFCWLCKIFAFSAATRAASKISSVLSLVSIPTFVGDTVFEAVVDSVDDLLFSTAFSWMNASVRLAASIASSRADLASFGAAAGVGATGGGGGGAEVVDVSLILAPIPILAARDFFFLILGLALLVPKVTPAPAMRPPVFAGVVFKAGVTMFGTGGVAAGTVDDDIYIGARGVLSERKEKPLATAGVGGSSTVVETADSSLTASETAGVAAAFMKSNPDDGTLGVALIEDAAGISAAPSGVAVAESCAMNENPLVMVAGAASAGAGGASGAGTGAAEFMNENEDVAGAGAAVAVAGSPEFMKPNPLIPGAAVAEGSGFPSPSSSAALEGVASLICRPPNILRTVNALTLSQNFDFVALVGCWYGVKPILTRVNQDQRPRGQDIHEEGATVL